MSCSHTYKVSGESLPMATQCRVAEFTQYFLLSLAVLFQGITTVLGKATGISCVGACVWVTIGPIKIFYFFYTPSNKENSPCNVMNECMNVVMLQITSSIRGKF